MSIASAIQNAQQKVANAYTAVSGKGGTLPATQDLSNLPTAINSISTGGGGSTLISKTIVANGTYNASSDNADGYSSVTVNVSGGGSGWQPNPDWWDIESILNADTRDYAGKAILLYSNSDNFTTFTISSPIVAVATSDGAFYTSTTTHTWDRTKDKIVSDDEEDTTPKYGTRYVILYFDTQNPDITAFTGYSTGCIYAVFGCNPTSSAVANGFFRNNRYLQSFKFLNGYNMNIGVYNTFCYSCYSLAKLPDNLDVSNNTNFQDFCGQCYSLTELPDNLDVSSGTNFRGFCYNDYSLTKLPDNLDVSSGTNFRDFCLSCYCLAKLPDSIDISSGTDVYRFCNNNYNLVNANIKLPNVSISLSSSVVIDIQSLEYIANNAPTVTGTVTLTIGSMNITRAGGASGSIITTLTNKGWTVN